MLEFWKNEWKLFLEDIGFVKNTFASIFGGNKQLMLNQAQPQQQPEVQEQLQVPVMEQPVEEMVTMAYQPDGIDNKVTAYFGESLEELRNSISGARTQHEVLREYAQYFKPYAVEQEMCNSAFRKYYDRHALKIATEELPIEQARIIQNNVDLFIKGQ